MALLNIVDLTNDQKISGVKTFAQGVDLNNIDTLILSGVDITITSGVVNLTNPLGAPNLVYNTGNQNITGIKTFKSNIIAPNLADQFPANPTLVRRYYPESTFAVTTTVPASGRISYFPFLIKEDVVNPKLCIEMTSSGAGQSDTSTLIQLGLYSGNNGFQGAPLFWSGSITALGSSTGILRTTANINLNKGPYIAASVNTGTLAPYTFRCVASNGYRNFFGDNTGESNFCGATTLLTRAFYETGSFLKQFIGTGSSEITAVTLGPLVAIEY
jgi:hypothetical protein